MDVRMPDGTIITNVPEGTTQSELLRRLNLARKTEAEARPSAVPAPEPTGESGFIPSVMRGGRGLYSLFGDVLPAMAAKAVGQDEYAKQQMEEAAKYQEETQRLYPAAVGSYKDIKDVGTALTYVEEAIGEAIPSMIPSIFTGGAAGILSAGARQAAFELAKKEAFEAAKATAGKELMKATGKGALTREAVEEASQKAIAVGTAAAQRVALKYEAAGAVAGSAAQNIPDVYQNLYENAPVEGELPDLAPALVAGGFNAVLDALVPLKLLRKARTAGIPDQAIIGAWYKRAGKGAVEGFLTEGGTEAVQEMSSAAAESFINENQQFFSKENFERFIDAGLKGALGGAAITSTANVAFGRAEKETPPPAEAPAPAPAEPPAAGPAPAILTPENVTESDEYKTAFESYRGHGLSREDADALARESILGRGASLPETPTTEEGKVPPVETWTVPALTATLEQQLTKEGGPNTALVNTISAELTKRGVDVQRISDYIQERIDAGIPPAQAAKDAFAQIRTETEADEQAAREGTLGDQRAGETVSAPSGAGVRVAEQPAAGAVPTGTTAPEPTGVVSTGADVSGPAERTAEQPSTVRQLALEEQKAAGWNPSWPFVPADLTNADFRQLILDDPNVSPEEKQQIFESGYKLGVVPEADLTAVTPATAPATAPTTETTEAAAPATEAAAPATEAPTKEKKRSATVAFRTPDSGVVYNESVSGGLRRIEEDDDIALEYPERVGAVMLTGIDRQASGQKGRASDVLKALTTWADTNNERLVLMPAASGDLKQPELIKWYERNGFEQKSDGAMERAPAPTTEIAEAAPAVTTPTTGTTEAPAVAGEKPKRGRPKIELTEEQQKEKTEAQQKRNAEYKRNSRRVQEASDELEALAQPIDETKFDNDESLATERETRAARKTKAIRTLLELRNYFGKGTKPAEQLKAAMSRPEISEKEKTDILAGIELLRKSGRSISRSVDPNQHKVNPALSTATNGAQAISAIFKTSNPLMRLIANRLRKIVGKVPVIVVEKDGPVPDALKTPAAAAAWDGARGLYVAGPDGKGAVYLRGASFGRDHGVNNVTALHELLHAATQQKLYLGFRAMQPGVKRLVPADSDMVNFTRRIGELMVRTEQAYWLLEEKGVLPKRLRALVESTIRIEDGEVDYDIFANPAEFLAYGLSDPDFQELLNAIPAVSAKPVSLFNRFIAAIRDVLGLPTGVDTALSELINATDRIIASRKPAILAKLERGEYAAAMQEQEYQRILAQNKQKKKRVDKVQQKIAVSERAQDVVDNAGVLTALRSKTDFLDTVEALWSSLNTTKLRGLLPALQRSTIVEWGTRLGIGGLKPIERSFQDMEVMRNNMLAAAAENTKQWLKLQPGVMKRLGKKTGERSQLTKLAALMHTATDKNIDPSVDTSNKELTQMWEELTPEARKIYTRIRDSYKAYFDLYRLLLDRRIAAMSIPGTVNDPSTPKGKIMAEIKKLYETGKAISPYFPLMRYGDYWLSLGKGKSRQFFMFESEMQRELFLKRELRDRAAQGEPEPEVEKGNSMRQLREKSVNKDTSNLLKDIFNAIDNAQTTTGLDTEALKDQIYQMYLTTMPEQTFRTQFIHRKATAGYSGDALRNYITSSLNMANQLARLKYGPQILNGIEGSRKSLEDNPDKAKLDMLIDELQSRADLDLFPKSDSPFLRGLTSMANRTSFLYYMTSVKTALSQFASLPVFGMPVLMSRHNPAKVMKEAMRFMNVFNQFGVVTEEDGKLKFVAPTIESSKAVKLSPEEQQAIAAMRDRGIADITLTYDLMDRRSTPTTKYVGAAKTAMNVMGALFHNVERLNREVMFMTSFRLSMDEAKKQGLTGPAAVEAAVEQAVNDTYTALGNFTEGERPRVMRGTAGKFFLQFKVFPAFLTTYMVRNFYRMLPYLNKEGKKEAATQFFGTLGMSYLLAGYVGIPGISFAFGAMQALLNALKDEEEEDPLEEKDLETWFRNVWLPQVFGEIKIGDRPLSDILDAGVLNSISGYDMNSSLSMNNIWFPELKEGASYQAEMQDYLISLAGPTVGLLVKQIPGAMDDFRSGKFQRGVEKLMPNLIRQPMAAARYAEEGAKTAAGDTIREKEEFTKGQLAMQAIGYRTEGLADAQSANFKANSIRQKTMQEKNRLIARIDLEAASGDDEAFDTALEKLLQFNSRNPSVAVKPEQLSNILESRLKRRMQSDRGFRVDKNYYPYLEVLLAPSRAKLEREAAK